MHQRIVVAGGGIGGLHFAAAAKQAGFRNVTVVERDPDVVRTNAGGGLGLWPPSLACAHRIGALPALEAAGQYMPAAQYLDATGASLGRPSATFATSKFPVLCLGRDRLLAALHERCVAMGVDFITGTAIDDVRGVGGDSGNRSVALSSGAELPFDVLIGADGIHSNVRRRAVAPTVKAESCGYAYYRATTAGDAIAAAGGQRWRSDTAFEAWGDGIRFGYVPLKAPEVFWFAAVPLSDEPSDVRARIGATGAAIVKDEASVAWLADRFASWAPKEHGRLDGVDVSALVRSSFADGILRTEICKVPRVTTFSWHAHGGRVVLLGDACHATAPNIAQGAGLSIEDGSELAHQLRNAAIRSGGNGSKGFDDAPLEAAMRSYETARKPRAAAVQRVADTIAVVGQLRGPMAKARDWAMWSGATVLPRVTAYMFEAAVSYSLGGSWSGDLHWRPPAPAMVVAADRDGSPDGPLLLLAGNTDCPERSAVARAVGLLPFLKLPTSVRRARQGANVLVGVGSASVEHPRASFPPSNAALGVLRRLFGLPRPTDDSSGFVAGVTPATAATAGRESWTRVFGWPDGTSSAAFTTTMRTRRYLGDDRRCPTGVVLCEGAGVHPWIDRVVSFGYAVSVVESQQGAEPSIEVRYDSVGVWIGPFRLGIVPSFLLPRSSWREVLRTDPAAGTAAASWEFRDGVISWPLAALGSATPLMRYGGSFRETSLPAEANDNRRRVLVTGGTGLLGEAVVAALAARGADVVVLTRDPAAIARPMAGVTYSAWCGSHGAANPWWRLLTPDCVVVNLAGENPGATRWNDAVRRRIVRSRLDAIAELRRGFDSAGIAPAAVLQASALVPSTEAAPSDGAAFRRSTVHEIAAAAEALATNSGVRHVRVLDIGIVLSTEGGLCPHTRLAARLGCSRIGTGSQLVPCIPVDDAAATIASMVESVGGSSDAAFKHVTLASATVTNTALLAELRTACHAAGTFAAPCGVIPVPGPLLQAAAGPSACVVLDSNRPPEETSAGGADRLGMRRVESLGWLLSFTPFFSK